LPFWDAPDTTEFSRPFEQGQLDLRSGIIYVAEFHLALASVGGRLAHTKDTHEGATPLRVQRTWAALAASLVVGQRLRLLHVAAGAGARARPYRLLVCGQGVARDADEALALARRLRAEFQVALEVVAPDLGLRDLDAAADLLPLGWPEVASLEPAALAVVASASPTDPCATGSGSSAVWVPLPAGASIERLSSGLDALACCPSAAAIQIDLIPVRLNDAERRSVRLLVSRLLDLPLARLAQVGLDRDSQPVTAPMVQAAESALRDWMHGSVGLRMCVTVRSPDALKPPGTTLWMVGDELWQGRPFSLVSAGCRQCRQPGDSVDLSGLLLPSQPWPPLLPDPELLRVQGLPMHQVRRPDSLPETGALLGHVPVAVADIPARLHESAWSRHCHVLGGSGTGKTRLLQSMISDRLRQPHSLILLDPHGDLFQAAHLACPTWRDADVVSLDFGDFDHAPSLNLLQCTGDRPDVEQTFLIHALCETFVQMYPENKEAFGPMFFAYLTNAARLVMSDTEMTATLLDVPRVFSEPLFRRALVERCKNAEVRAFWRGIALRAGGEASLENVAPYIVSKFVDLQHPPMRAFLGQAESTIDLRAIMDRGGVLLINLAKGRLGARQSRFLGLLLTSRILAAVLSRADQPVARRRDLHLVVDEFGSMVASAFDFETVLSEGRKYGVRAVLAHQHMAQLPPALAQSLLTNTGSRILMRLGAEDAQTMARWVGPEFDAQALMTLPDRHAVARMQVPGGVTPPFLMHTLECPDLPDDAATQTRFEALRASSRARYCTPAAAVERDIAQRRVASLPPPSAAADGKKEGTETTSAPA
jgi:Helicase HerA, central domain/TraM recognition site of TraD and TraG